MEKKKVPEIRLEGFEGEWERVPLKQIAQKVVDKNVNREYTETFTNSAESGIISQRDYFDHNIANTENIDTYYIVCDDDFAYNPRISNNAPVGPIKRNKLGRKGIMSPLYTVFRTHDVDNTYLEWYFNSSCWHPYMYFNGDSGARYDRFSIKSDVFFDMPISLPSLPEQKAIGEYFANLDNLIKNAEDRHTKLLALKKSLLQKMFPQEGESVPRIRFEGFEGEWEKKKLGTIAKEIVRKDSSSDAPVMMISAASGFIYQSDRYSTNNAGQSLPNYTVLRKNELAYNHGFSNLRPFGSCFNLRIEEARVPFVYHCFSVADNNPGFISMELNSYFVEQQLRKLVSSTARMDGLLNISFEDYATVEIFVPHIDEQKKIVDYFDNLDNLIEAQEQKITKLKQMKSALLQKMFV